MIKSNGMYIDRAVFWSNNKLEILTETEIPALWYSPSVLYEVPKICNCTSLDSRLQTTKESNNIGSRLFHISSTQYYLLVITN